MMMMRGRRVHVFSTDSGMARSRRSHRLATRCQTQISIHSSGNPTAFGLSEIAAQNRIRNPLTTSDRDQQRRLESVSDNPREQAPNAANADISNGMGEPKALARIAKTMGVATSAAMPHVDAMVACRQGLGQ